jgi:hypothetical protein
MAVYRGMNLYDHFILDSGTSSHIIGRKDMFMSGIYRAIDYPTSKGIGDSSLKAISIGTIMPGQHSHVQLIEWSNARLTLLIR